MTPKVNEAGFQKTVVQFARLRGWRVASFRRVRVQRKDGSVYYETPAGDDGVGWLDLFMTRRDRCLAAELKVGKNKRTPEQTAWSQALASAGVEVYLWRPEHWQEIEEVLK